MVWLALTLNACKKSTTDDTKPISTTGTLLFHLHTNLDSNEVDYGPVYHLNDGRKISITKAQLYITQIKAVKPDGSVYDSPASIILKVLEKEIYLVGSIPAGDYKSVRFNVGIDSVRNQMTLASYDSSINNPDMWFGSVLQSYGSVFVNFQGTIDTSMAGNGSIAQMQSFSYKIGQPNLKVVSMPDKNFTIVPDQAYEVHITINYAKLFSGISLNVAGNLEMNTLTQNNSQLASKLSDNITSMFSYEE